MPRSQTPVGQPALASIGLANTAFRTLNYVGPTMASLSRLNHAACLLAVYASPVRLPQHDARLTTGLLARLWPGGTSTPWTPFLTFKETSATSFPIKPGFSWRPQDLTPFSLDLIPFRATLTRRNN